jgi:1A family penicillin-binding protein
MTNTADFTVPLQQPGQGTPSTGGRPPEHERPFYMRRRWQIPGAIALLVLLVVVWLSWALPLGRALEPLPTPTIVLISSDGQAFARRGSYKEAPVDVRQLPPHVAQAFLSIEDRRFYHHWGIDPRGVARALRNNARNDGERLEGGSTITQQLAKNAFLSNRRTLRRKVQEAIIALYLEARLSKDEILSRYLSSVYFGDGVYGLRAASRHFFNKRPEQLSIGEAAMLAGVVKAPSRLAPTVDIKAARARERIVLEAMVETGAITQAQARRSRSVRVREGRVNLPVGSYFADWVSSRAREAYQRAYGEVRVPTTLDSRLQRHAETVVRRYLDGPGRARNASQAALVAMRTDGSVVAMVGGHDYKSSQFNRAVDAERQPGSAFKLFVYLTALRQGLTPDSLVLDAPVKIGGWTPQNYEGEYLGRPISLRTAFARSSNVAAARVVQQVGVNDVIRTARELGINTPLPRDATIALGTGSVTLLQLTSAYAAIAAGSTPVRPRGLMEFAPTGPVHAVRPREQRGMLELLREVVTSGTGRAASLSIPVYGKTGTTQDYKDAWFVGMAGDLIIGVWVGNDDNSPMDHVTGGGMPAQIWRDFASVALSRVPAPPPAPEDELTDEELQALAEQALASDAVPADSDEDEPGDIPQSRDGPPADFAEPEAPEPPEAEPPVIQAPPPPDEPGQFGATG